MNYELFLISRSPHAGLALLPQFAVCLSALLVSLPSVVAHQAAALSAALLSALSPPCVGSGYLPDTRRPVGLFTRPVPVQVTNKRVCIAETKVSGITNDFLLVAAVGLLCNNSEYVLDAISGVEPLEISKIASTKKGAPNSGAPCFVCVVCCVLLLVCLFLVCLCCLFFYCCECSTCSSESFL